MSDNIEKIRGGGYFELSYSKFVEYLNKIPPYVKIIFGGFAECFLNRACKEMIRYAAGSHRVFLYTTLVGIQKEDVDEVLSFPYEKCVIHIPDAEGYAAIHADNDYRYILKRFLQAKNRDGNPVVSHLSCQGTPSPVVKDLIGSYFVLNYLEDRAGLLEDEKVKKSGYVGGSIVCRHCGTKLNHNMLLPDGTVVLCCNDWGLKHPLGSLEESSYEEIIGGKAREYIRRSMLIEEENDILCRHCIQAKCIDDLPIDTWQTEEKAGIAAGR